MDKLFFGSISATPPASTGYVNGYPTDGDPTTGVGATTPGAYWFFMIMMELINLIVGAGLTPNGAVLTQVLAAVQAIATTAANAAQAAAITAATALASAAQAAAVATVLAWFTGSNQSLIAAGYQKLPGGFIVQWGTFTCPGGGSYLNVTLPMTFPNAGLAGVATTADATAITATESVSTTVIRVQNGGGVGFFIVFGN